MSELTEDMPASAQSLSMVCIGYAQSDMLMSTSNEGLIGITQIEKHLTTLNEMKSTLAVLKLKCLRARRLKDA